MLVRTAEREQGMKYAGRFADLVDHVAENMHHNESMHLHDLTSDYRDCGYCFLRAGRALGAVEQVQRESFVPLDLLSRALDEIYALRGMAAYEAGVREADLTYKTYPKSRRDIAKDRIQKLQAVARGEWRHIWNLTPRSSVRHSMREAGASELLTRSSWEAEQR